MPKRSLNHSRLISIMRNRFPVVLSPSKDSDILFRRTAKSAILIIEAGQQSGTITGPPVPSQTADFTLLKEVLHESGQRKVQPQKTQSTQKRDSEYLPQRRQARKGRTKNYCPSELGVFAPLREQHPSPRVFDSGKNRPGCAIHHARRTISRPMLLTAG